MADEWNAQSIGKLIKDSNNWSFLLELVAKKPHLITLKLPQWSESMIHWAALGNTSAIVEFFAKGVDLNVPDAQNRTALDWAVEALYFETQELEMATNKKDIAQAQQLRKKVQDLCSSIELLVSYGARSCLEKEYDILDLVLHCGAWSLSLKIAGFVEKKQRHLDSLLFGVKKKNLLKMERDFSAALGSASGVNTQGLYSRVVLFYHEDVLREEHLEYLFSIYPSEQWSCVNITQLTLEKQMFWEESVAGSGYLDIEGRKII